MVVALSQGGDGGDGGGGGVSIVLRKTKPQNTAQSRYDTVEITR